MQLECGYAHFIDDVPFEVKYGSSSASTQLKLAVQLPKMLAQVYKEHQHLKKVVADYHIDAVISDNRYGLYHQTIPCYFITHQTNINAPFGAKWLNKINHYFINKFKSCLIPDFENEANRLAGKLSDVSHLKNFQFIGLLSRAKAITTTVNTTKILYLLSGVEPQRSILENLIIEKQKATKEEAILVRGSNIENKNLNTNLFVECHNWCAIDELNMLVADSNFIVCRAGYSTIMDVVQWQKKAVIIPTPGQSEQEYLADYLSKKTGIKSVVQSQFLLFNFDEMQDVNSISQLSEQDFDWLDKLV